jgi:hypothetical protein
MIAANIFPGDMPPNVGSNNNNVRNPWGGGTIVYANANAAFPNTFRISYYGIPASACTKIAAGVISKSNSFDADPVAFVTHGGQNGPNSTPNLTTTAVDATSIAVSCGFNTEANDATNSIEFDFKMTR